mmetsp:Transcript_4959/g.16388  ORF Transcript_4959/g.16388 Transcript_4959/m.16388 type:complete len:363 (-) Transcript_4959:198-1286(-)
MAHKTGRRRSLGRRQPTGMNDCDQIRQVAIGLSDRALVNVRSEAIVTHRFVQSVDAAGHKGRNRNALRDAVCRCDALLRLHVRIGLINHDIEHGEHLVELVNGGGVEAVALLVITREVHHPAACVRRHVREDGTSVPEERHRLWHRVDLEVASVVLGHKRGLRWLVCRALRERGGIRGDGAAREARGRPAHRGRSLRLLLKEEAVELDPLGLRQLLSLVSLCNADGLGAKVACLKTRSTKGIREDGVYTLHLHGVLSVVAATPRVARPHVFYREAILDALMQTGGRGVGRDHRGSRAHAKDLEEGVGYGLRQRDALQWRCKVLVLAAQVGLQSATGVEDVCAVTSSLGALHNLVAIAFAHGE